ncbi:hypothetical protein BDU57DRAFT_579410, partial [Ampelomyces quisqualis]
LFSSFFDLKCWAQCDFQAHGSPALSVTSCANFSACAYGTPCVFPGAEKGKELVSITLKPRTPSTVAFESKTASLGACLSIAHVAAPWWIAVTLFLLMYSRICGSAMTLAPGDVSSQNTEILDRWSAHVDSCDGEFLVFRRVQPAKVHERRDTVICRSNRDVTRARSRCDTYTNATSVASRALR